MLIINNDEVAELLTMADCIRVQEEAFCGLPAGHSIHRPRVDLYYPCDRDDGYWRWGTMEGASGDYFAIRMKSDIVTWPKVSERYWTEEKYCIEPGTYFGLILVMSTRNGEPLAFINDGILQHMRVGAGAGLGAKYLARDDAHVVAMIGSGGMARTYLEAFAGVRDIQQCRVYSPTTENRTTFAAEMSAKLNMDVVAVDSARAAVCGADIVASCTDSMLPVYEADWLEPGMHVTNVAVAEIPDDALDRFDVFVRQGTLAIEMAESERFQSGRGGTMGAFIGGTAEEMQRLPARSSDTGVLGDSAATSNRGRGADKPDFADLVAGKCKGRTDARQITFYRNIGNQGLQFSSVGGWVYARALAEKKGRTIPTEWFLQNIRD